ncbi:MAG: type 1 glutamine amidotransferase [Rhodobacter sp.]|nr:type 1 glutamine amidotransferase [Rhodobacter sp.]
MHIAILMTNTDESAFAARHPRDGEKFTALIQEARPGWTTEVHGVKDGAFPESLAGLGGVVITGSPASARSDAAWVQELLQVIRDAVAEGLPLFGACFGHQAIARALGGAVGENDGPFVLGLVDVLLAEAAPWMTPAPARVRIAAAHGEQVTKLPDGAVVNAEGPGCAIGGFHIGDRVFTTEYHPEMTHGFVAALIDALDGKMDPAVIARARASLDRPADRALFAEWIARFFEHAR